MLQPLMHKNNTLECDDVISTAEDELCINTLKMIQILGLQTFENNWINVVIV